MGGTTASIIINNYNYGRFLGAAIESALAQVHSCTEVIVVDDGSTDNSREVMTQFEGRIVNVFQHNGGQGSAINAGFRASRGDVVCFLDADDILFPSAVEQVVSLLQDAEVVKVHWTLRVIDETGRDAGKVIPEKTPPDGNLRASAIQEGPCYDWLSTPPTSGTAYRRSTLLKVLPMPESEYRVGADEYLTSLAPLYGEIRTILTPQGCYRMHGRNNYYGKLLDDKCLLEYVRRFNATCQAMRDHLQRQGIAADIDDWRQRNFNYQWPTRLVKARQDITHCVPPESQFILIDQNEWGNYANVVPGRHPVPFCERDNEYWGPPINDDQAIQELLGQQERGIRYVVLWWTARWWLDEYPQLRNFLETRADCVLTNEGVTIFRLHD